MNVPVRELGPDELDGWDAAAVDAPGGHVLQSRAWAEHRAAAGLAARYLAAGDVRALVLGRPWPLRRRRLRVRAARAGGGRDAVDGG